MPVRPVNELLLTRFEMVFDAVSMDEKMDSSSESSGFASAVSIMNRLRVTPVSEQTSEKMGAVGATRSNVAALRGALALLAADRAAALFGTRAAAAERHRATTMRCMVKLAQPIWLCR